MTEPAFTDRTKLTKSKQDLADFASCMERCLWDPRLVNYFHRELVSRDDVGDKLKTGGAFYSACQTPAYEAYDSMRAECESVATHCESILNRSVNVSTGLISILSIPLVFSIVAEMGRQSSFIRLPAILIGAALVTIAVFMLSTRMALRHLFSLAILCIGICVVATPHVFFDIPWSPKTSVFTLAFGAFIGYAAWDSTSLAKLIDISQLPRSLFLLSAGMIERRTLRKKWLAELPEDVIMPHAIRVVNAILGEDHDRLLVEQNSDGLRRLNDQSFTVSTASTARVYGTLSRFDGGSIALSGPRGVGKSTLMRTICRRPHAPQKTSHPELAIFISAPSEYAPRDFFVELFQRLCEDYLAYRGYPYAPALHARTAAGKRFIGLLRHLLPRALRLGISVALGGILIWSFEKDIRSAFFRFSDTGSHFYGVYVKAWARSWWTHHRGLTQILIGILAVVLMPSRKQRRAWRRYHDPQLVIRARDYLFRLQTEKTVTAGFNAGIPGLPSGSLALSRGSSFKHASWTLPELVTHIRRFIAAVAREEKLANRRLIIAIDEIDRIGSAEQAERFISEVKAVFGIDNCFFLVSVAEDVGSSFARRAIAPRSVFENAFDDVVVIDPLSLRESGELLLRRVPGFTDAFAYLAHSLSGGIPRELIRITRRLVELNEEAREKYHVYPKLEDLSRALVKEALLETLAGARNIICQLLLDDEHTEFFDRTQTLLAEMRSEHTISVQMSRPLIEWLAYLEPGELASARPPADAEDSSGMFARANDVRRLLIELSAFAFLGLTVIDAFAYGSFDLRKARNLAPTNAGSYEQLASARRELSTAPLSCRVTLQRFRKAWGIGC